MTDSAQEFITGESRLSFVSLQKARGFDENSTPKYEVTFLVPKSDTATVASVEAALAAAEAQAKDEKINLPRNYESCWRDGDDSDYDGYADHWALVCKNTSRPVVVDADGSEVLDLAQVYSGAYGRGKVRVYPYGKGRKGIAAQVIAVQKTRDGEPFGAAPMTADKAAEEFGSFTV